MKELIGKYFFCKTTRLFNHLATAGCKFVKAVPDKFNPRYQVFLFKVDDNLKDALDSYKIKIKENYYKKVDPKMP